MLASTCTRRPRGFAVPFSFNNVYHAIFHAVPAYESMRALMDTTSAEMGTDFPLRLNINTAQVRHLAPSPARTLCACI